MRFRSPLFIAAILLMRAPLFAEDAPFRVVMLSGSLEYKSAETLPVFKDYLEQNYNAKCVILQAIGETDLPGTEALENCDTALFFTRRLKIEGDSLERVKNYCEAGKPIVGVRTASHGFQNWLEFDKIVLGGNYQNHYPVGPTTKITVNLKAKTHPILEGVLLNASRSSLYKNTPIADDTELLLTGSIPKEQAHPIAWTRMHNGGRVFYTSLGSPDDFAGDSFKRMIANALFWSANREPLRRPLPDPPRRTKPEGTLKLSLRTRAETAKGNGDWKESRIEREFPVAETAIIICDMWDKHWCSGATGRCAQIAEKMNPVLKAARAKGVQIIHAPSDTMGFYLDSPQRRRMTLAPAAEPPAPLNLTDPPLPIDDRDGGCDTDDTPQYNAWTRQHPAIEIGEFDGISDNGREVYNFLRQEGIKNLLIMGVHTNMCVLGRSFAIRQMSRWGIQCVLVRDLTDTMYDPKDPPHVPHDQGTELVVEHIEKYWCPSVTSEELVGGLPGTP